VPKEQFYKAEMLYEHAKQQHPTHQYIKDFESLARAYYRHLINAAKQKNLDFSVYQRKLEHFSKEEK
jgi:hypothetical protein